MVHFAIHRVEKITIKEIRELKETNSYSLHLEIKSENNSTIEIVLFSDKIEKLSLNIESV